MTAPQTTWGVLAEAADALSEPFSRGEIFSWVRRHYPDVVESTLGAHIQFATAEASPESRGAFANRTPILSRVARGSYIRYRSVDRVTRSKEGSVVISTPRLEPLDQSEMAIQAAIVTHLAVDNWQILSVADTASKAHGYDIVAQRDGHSLRVEVKGYPLRTYANGGGTDNPKPTHPATQARQYFSHALLKLLVTLQDHPDDIAGLGLPEETTYLNLVERTTEPLSTLGVTVFWVARDGSVREQDLSVLSNSERQP